MFYILYVHDIVYTKNEKLRMVISNCSCLGAYTCLIRYVFIYKVKKKIMNYLKKTTSSMSAVLKIPQYNCVSII